SFFEIKPAVLTEFIRFPGNYRRLEEILGWRRRTGAPLQTRQHPWIRSCLFAPYQGMNQIYSRHQKPDSKNRSPGGRENIEHLKLRWIRGIASRHSLVAENELREE